jgi:ATP-dependent helicase HrpA
VREWFDVHRQLRQLRRARRRGGGDGRSALVHRAILAGLLSHIGILDTRSCQDEARRQAPTAGDVSRCARSIVRDLPGSALRKASPDAVMAAELVETSRLFARTVAAIDPAWAEEPPAISRTGSSATRTGRRMPGPPSPPRR